MAAAGSTISVMNKYGDMYTRVADFDTEGNDPLFFFHYTYDPKSPEWQRVLPGEDWVKQSKIDGHITGRLTVVQTGSDSRDRELHVEGVNNEGQAGYYAKPVNGGEWRFEPTSETISQPFIDNRAADCTALTLGASRDVDLQGTFEASWLFGSRKVSAELRQFNMDCSPAVLHLDLDGKSYDCKLHLRHFYFKGLVLATLELPDELLHADGPAAKELVASGMGKQKFVALQADIEGKTLHVHNTLHLVDMHFTLP
jgi:hypothetical protein